MLHAYDILVTHCRYFKNIFKTFFSQIRILLALVYVLFINVGASKMDDILIFLSKFSDFLQVAFSMTFVNKGSFKFNHLKLKHCGHFFTILYLQC